MEDDVEWMNEHGIPTIIGCLVERLITCRPEDPITFLIHMLQQRRAASGTLTASNATPRAQKLTILHFNDVYNIEPQDSEPIAGAARFMSMVQSLDDPLVLFSGDAFNPSTMSTCTKGKQMPPILSALGVKVACIGNHDFDHGIGPLTKLLRSCDFPWLLSNVFLRGKDEPLGGAKMTHILDWKGHLIGFMGLVEYEWLTTLAAIDENEIDYVDFVPQGQHLAEQLRLQGCTFIVALTHMRIPNDQLLADQGTGIDLILGGHDHHYEVHRCGLHGRWLVKSGTDFREATEVTIHFGEAATALQEGDPECGEVEREGNFYITTKRLEVDSKYPEHPAVAAMVKVFEDQMGKSMNKIVAFAGVELDSRFEMIRRQETNCSNFVADAVRGVTNADVVLLNSGTLRADRVFPTGPLRTGDVSALLPMVDPIVVLQINGRQIIEALENGICKYPALEGRFPIVSGLQFAFDPTNPPGSRVIAGSVVVNQERIEEGDIYTLATKEYLAAGKDGYEVFKRCRVVVESELLPPLQTMIHRYLFMLSVMSGLKQDHAHAVSHALPAKGKMLDPRRHGLSRVSSVASFGQPRGAAETEHSMWGSGDFSQLSVHAPSPRLATNPVYKTQLGTPVFAQQLHNLVNVDDLSEQDRTRCIIAPAVEGRITAVFPHK
eukprot:GGOE01036864.1.p1 GENE.GGOE01036864.1~~GGOE01036864.1.p1  ORF type:complete len:684 (+),score=206.12 GGOE01036864.1:67-2052(+)